jgi:hypothetical protein
MLSSSNAAAVSVVSVVVFAIGTHALDNGVGVRPTLGWNSWNIFAERLDEQVVRDTVRRFHPVTQSVGGRERLAPL